MNCECHGERMGWRRDPRYRNGGYWRCRVLERVGQRRRYQENPEVRLNQQLRNMSRIRVVN